MHSRVIEDKDVILFVDDEESNLFLFHEYLKLDYTVLTAINTHEAYDLIRKNPVKILVADQRMPDETGLEFIKRISPEFPDILKIIFTAHADHDAILKAINQGDVFRYILKPWNTHEIKQILKDAIREFNLRFENKRLVEQLAHKNLVLEKAYHQIRENEKKFTGIFQASSDGMLLLKGHKILEANKALLEILGIKLHEYTPENLGSFLENSMKFVFTPDVNDENSVEFYDLMQKQKFLEIKRKIFQLSGEELLLFIIRDVTERKLMDQKILETIFRTQEETQNRYAQELHDGLGPVLSTVKMYVEWLCDHQNTLNRSDIENNVIHAVDEAISLSKEIANNLSPHILQRFGLENALINHSERIKGKCQTEVIINSGLKERLPAQVEITLYRVLLECMNNSIKHANPSRIMICLKRQEDNICISYSDNGIGFDVGKTLKESKGMGLFNMQNRIKMHRGTISINSGNFGTNIEIKLANLT